MGPSRILQRDQVGDTPLHEAINETIKKCTAGEEVIELAPNWQEVPDEASGNHYYWNNVTDETSWERPTASSRQPKGDYGCEADRKLWGELYSNIFCMGFEAPSLEENLAGICPPQYKVNVKDLEESQCWLGGSVSLCRCQGAPPRARDRISIES